MVGESGNNQRFQLPHSSLESLHPARVGVTGNRPFKIPEEQHQAVRDLISEVLSQLQQAGATSLLHGAALGVDMWSAKVAHQLGLELSAYVPFPQQADSWTDRERESYRRMLDAGEKRVFSQEAHNGAYFDRNRAIVEESDIVLGIHSPGGGGGAWTTKLAIDSGVPTIRVIVTKEDLQVTFHNFEEE